MAFKYTGILAKRRLKSKRPLLTSKDRREWEAREHEEETIRLLELFRVHGVEPPDWAGLAIALARANVPGMTTEKAGRGTPEKWPPYSLFALRFNVDQYAAEHGVSIKDACEAVANREPYRSKLGSGGDPKLARERAIARDPTLKGNPERLAKLEREREKQLAVKRGAALHRQYNRCNSGWAKLLDDARADNRPDVDETNASTRGSE